MNGQVNTHYQVLCATNYLPYTVLDLEIANYYTYWHFTNL